MNHAQAEPSPSTSLRALLVDCDAAHAKSFQEQWESGREPRIMLEWQNSIENLISSCRKTGCEVILLHLDQSDQSLYRSIERLHQLLPEVPIIVMTSERESSVGLEALRYGAQDYLHEGEIATPGHLRRVILFALERQQFRDRLTESRRAYAELFTHMLDGFALFEKIPAASDELDDFKVLEVNPAFERMTGLSAGRIVGRPIREVLPTLESGWLATFSEVCSSGRPQRFVRYSSALDKHLQVSAFCPRSGQFAAIFEDVSERVSVMAELERSRAIMARTEAMSRVGSWEWDIEKREMQWSNELFRIHDLEPGKHTPSLELLEKLYGTRQIQLAVEQARKTFNQDDLLEGELRLGRGGRNEERICRYQAYAERDLQGRPTRIYGSLQDVTEQYLAEAERDRLVAAVEQATEEIIITDADGVIVYANGAFLEGTGYALEECLGQTMAMVQSPRIETGDIRKRWSILSQGDVWRGRFINRRRDGTEYELNSRTFPIRDARSRTIGFVTVQHDLTLEQQQAAERIELEAKLLQSQKMDAIGRLAGGVAHDFNNMLQAILGYSECAIEPLSESDPLRQDLLEIQKAAERSADLTRQLLAFARQQPIHPRRIDLNETVSGMLKMLRRIIGEDIELRWTPSNEKAIVMIDPAQVDQLLANLAVNARDAIEGVGAIDIRCEVRRCQEVDKDWQTPEMPCVQLIVSDTGCGIPEEAMQHIFEPFFTTKEPGKGTGLGLATVYGIVQQNGGSVKVESVVGAGTSFILCFPLAEAEVESQVTMEPVAQARGSETLLLVEDEEALLVVARRHLEKAGYHVLTASKPSVAIQIAESLKGNLDLLITDVVMPEMHGFDLTMRIRDLHPKARVLYVSGYTPEIIRRHGVLDLNAEFIQKPYTATKLSRKVREICDHRSDTNLP